MLATLTMMANAIRCPTCRFTWDVIRRNREGRAIVLTTHSMEEADLLADHIAIMAQGHIVADGTSADLKSRYGVGYTLTLARQRAEDANGACVSGLISRVLIGLHSHTRTRSRISLKALRPLVCSRPRSLPAELYS